MQHNIAEVWLHGLKGEDREKMKAFVLANTILLDKLAKILYNMQVRSESTVLSDYDTPSWSHKQAHVNGFNDAIKKISEICTVRERDDPSQTE